MAALLLCIMYYSLIISSLSCRQKPNNRKSYWTNDVSGALFIDLTVSKSNTGPIQVTNSWLLAQLHLYFEVDIKNNGVS